MFHIVTSQTLDCHNEQTTTETKTDFVCEEKEIPSERFEDDFKEELEDLHSDGEDFREALEEYIERLSDFNAIYPNSHTLRTIREEQLLIHMKDLLDDLDEKDDEAEE